MSEAKIEQKPTLYRDGAFFDDEWVTLEDGQEIDGQNKVFVPFAKALALLESRSNLPEEFGVLVNPDDDVEELVPYLSIVRAVAIAFPAFADGRGFSSARLLSERYGYEGELRAVGNYILDQMPFLVRCGITSFAVTSEKLRAGLKRGEWPEVTNYYQPTGQDGAGTIASRPWLRQRLG